LNIKLNKIVLALGLALAVFLIVLSFFSQRPRETRVCFDQNCFRAEIADNARQRARGLMFRRELAPDRGMLFVFEKEGIHPFWMKSTLIPLDILWLDQGQKIVFVKENTPPCLKEPCEIFTPSVRARYVLEINAGRVRELGFEIGDGASF
jgi:uncharacterized membrane protein (UPF0127 family)